jgi:hypothetical protein
MHGFIPVIVCSVACGRGGGEWYGGVVQVGLRSRFGPAFGPLGMMLPPPAYLHLFACACNSLCWKGASLWLWKDGDWPLLTLHDMLRRVVLDLGSVQCPLPTVPGLDLKDAVEDALGPRLPWVKFVLPTAETKAVTLNMGVPLPAWVRRSGCPAAHPTPHVDTHASPGHTSRCAQRVTPHWLARCASMCTCVTV